MLMLPYNYFTCPIETNWSRSKTVIVIWNNLDTVAQLFCLFYRVSPFFWLFQWKYDLIQICYMLWFYKSSYTSIRVDIHIQFLVNKWVLRNVVRHFRVKKCWSDRIFTAATVCLLISKIGTLIKYGPISTVVGCNM